MPEVAEQQTQQDPKEQQEVEQQTEQQKRTYTEDEWKARQVEFDGKANKIRRNAAREAELKLRREMDARREQPQQRQQEQSTEPSEPKREDFPDYEAYLAALARHAGETAAREQRKKDDKAAGERQAAETRTSMQAEFKKRANAAMDEIPDFAETIEGAEDAMITESMGEAILESGVGPHILYRLAKDPQEAERISKLSKSGQQREIGKLEAKIEAEQEAAKKAKEKPKDQDDGEQPRAGEEANDGEEREERPRGEGGRFKAPEQETRRKAPDPIEPVSGRGGNTSTTPGDKDSDDVWYQKRLAEVARESVAGRRRAG